MSLNGKSAVVTGAAKGIGRAITELLLLNRAKVALLDVDETAGRSLKEVLDRQYPPERTLFLSCNVESEEQIKAALQKTAETFGGIDILCNNAGILNEATWEKTVSINMMGVIRGTYLALEHMSKLSGGRGGVIVNMASMAGLGPLPGCPVYTATKHGVVGFTRAMAVASTASGYGVRFNVVCPGFVQTDLFSALKTNLGRFSNMGDATEQLMQHLGVISVSEVAQSVLEMVTDETLSGRACCVSPKGRRYVDFPSFAQ
ncbi:15-hydroxyprostaglandin dehydrogenase [NAD(+)] [Pungitius pungitius]|uniref:15-hydroxyprostaglandin dehydrogenase [NAD(+)] n=1 Tax=Pungitius pungitius TaxID=134920 RepID=UPI002E0DD109